MGGIECPECHFVAGPAEAASNGGTCPNCTRPYRDQPTPLNSEMEMRDMPEPGMEDTGGNPLQEGMLGDYQNREKRDESYASVRKRSAWPFNVFNDEDNDAAISREQDAGMEPRCSICGGKSSDAPMGCPDPIHYQDAPLDGRYYELENEARGASTKPQFEVTEVIVPDPDSIRTDKEQMDKEAGFLDTLGDIGKDVAPVAGGVAGFALGGPIGAGIGAGLAGGGISALEGNGLGESLGTGALDGTLGLAGGAGAGALGLEGGAGLKALGMGASEAGEQGATSGGLASTMKSAFGKIPTTQLQRAYYGTGAMKNLGEGAADTGMGAMPPTGAQPAAALPASYYSAVETPSSQGGIPSNDTSDPEQVDFHEKNDESHEDPLSQIEQSPGGAGTDLGPDDFFEADSPAFAQFATLLPKVLEFALSDKSAAGDPDMESLHQALEAEKPGYLDKANDAHGEKLILAIMGGGQGQGVQDGKEQPDDLLQDNDTPHDPIAEHEATALRPGLESTCPRCGAITDPSSAHCPQCGLANPQHQGNPMGMTEPQAQSEGFPGAAGSVPVTAAAGQGPNDPQQQAAVAELLQQEGRDQEIPAMLTEPWNYAAELAKVTGQEEPPASIGAEGPPPPAAPPSQEGQSPVPGMSAPPGGAGGSQMMSAIKKYAATVDGVAEKCPKCGSHSTGYTSYEDGKLGCKTCGHKWTGKKMEPTVTSAITSMEHDTPPVPAVPDTQGEEQQQSPSDDGEQGNLSWTDASGAPLMKGQSYQLYSSSYSIPDPITINEVKPDVIEYTTHGEYGLSHRSEMTHEEANVMKYSFIPNEAPEEVQPEAGEEHPGTAPVPGPGEETDSSTPHEMQPMMSSRTAASPQELMMQHQQGIHFNDGARMLGDSERGHPECPMCQNPRMSGEEVGAIMRGEREPLPQPSPGAQNFMQMLMGGEPQEPNPWERTQEEPPRPPDPWAAQEEANRAKREQEEAARRAKTADFNDTNPPGVDSAGMGMAQPPTRDPVVLAHDHGAGAHTAPVQGCPFCTTAQATDPLEQQFNAPAIPHPTMGFEGSANENVETAGDWLLEDDSQDPDDLTPRTAGAKMTPWEQRDYIDEVGDARNSDKMNLGGTHYEMDDLSESFLWG